MKRQVRVIRRILAIQSIVIILEQLSFKIQHV